MSKKLNRLTVLADADGRICGTIIQASESPIHANLVPEQGLVSVEIEDHELHDEPSIETIESIPKLYSVDPKAICSMLKRIK